MARVDYGDPNDPALAALVGRIKSERGGRVLNLYRMLLNSPPVAGGWLAMLTAIRQQTILDGRCRELAILRVGQLTQAMYEYTHHIPIARREGISDEQISALDDYQASTLFDDRDRAVLAYATEMTRDVRVSEPTFAAVRASFDEREIVELTATIAAYNHVCRFLVALEIDID